MRKAEGKTLGTTVIPVVIDPDEDTEKVLSGSEFKRVWHVVRALRAHDEVLADELDAARRALGRQRTTVERVGKIVVDFPGDIDESFARAVDVKLVEASTPSWEMRFGTLEDFVEREGHARVPRDHLERGLRLGQWVGVQRSQYSKGKLSKERVARLETLPGWEWIAHDGRWDLNFAALETFVKREGHTLVPSDHMESGLRLGTWANGQRWTYRGGKLSKERIARLEALPAWEWSAFDERWDATFAALELFVEREDHALVPSDHMESGLRLGTWANGQRWTYSGCQISKERIARLEALPAWEWIPLDSKWDATFAALEAFVEREGHALVPQGRSESGFRLGAWVRAQRTRCRGGKLSEERIERLEALPAWTWDARDYDERWNTNFAALEAFVEREGHAREPAVHLESGLRLGKWVSVQRSQYGGCQLSKERINCLESLPGWAWKVRNND